MEEILANYVSFLKSIKAKNVATFDLSEGGQPKFFIVASFANNVETQKATDEVCEKFDFEGLKDGYHKGEWIILNLDPVILHLFTQADRAKYNLDRLYKSKEIDVLKIIKKKKSK